MTSTAAVEGLRARPAPSDLVNSPRISAPAAVLTLSLAFLALAGAACRSGPGGVDGRVIAWVAGHRAEWPALTALARGVTRLGDPAPAAATVAAVAVALLVLSRRGVAGIGRWEGPFWLAAAAGGHLAVLALKAVFRRERPPLVHRLVVENSFSFPSGHSNYAAVMLALAVALLAWRLGARPTWRRVVAAGLLLALALLVAASRVWLGVHYPSDVAGGLVLGTAWVVGACQVRSGWERRAGRAPLAVREQHLGAVGAVRLACAADPQPGG
jgi:undecaprenyl-diphosphatase